ncbi:MAG: hypothetical protein HPY60_09050 [Candidatus Methanofastidiosum sp.]|nr:hypothetical protein [Methanofastidiosum sp.]
MKKLYAIVISLLFVVSVCGIASLAATCTEGCGPTCSCSATNYHIDKTLITVGETFTFSKNNLCTYNESATPGSVDQTIQFVSGYTEGGWSTATFRAISPGIVTFTNANCGGAVTVKILPKSTPMDKFMKILGFGQKD